MPLGVVLSFAACSAVLLCRAPATGALHHYTDPVRQPVCTMLALEFGLDVYRVPYAELLARSQVRRRIDQWPAARYVYPPGALVAFLPPALLGQWTDLPDGLYRRLCGVWVAALVHLGLWFVLSRIWLLPSGWRAAVGALVWIFFARAALNGQYEPLWLAPAALAMSALTRGRNGPTLGWVALAFATHFRAIVLLPFAALALLRLLRAREGWGWMVGFGATGVLVAVCARWGLASPFRAESPLYTRPGDALFVLDVAGTIAGVGLAATLAGDGVLAAALALIGLVGLFDGPHWWHASAVFLPVLARDAAVKWRYPRAASAGLLGWMLAMEAVWLHRPVALFRDLRDLVRSEADSRARTSSVGSTGPPLAVREFPEASPRLER